MTDRPASWRMPTPKADGEACRCGCRRQKRAAGADARPGDEMPPEYWQAVLDDPRADARTVRHPRSGRSGCREIPRHVLRVSCRRCARIVEIQKADAVRLAGAQAVWKDVGQRLLDDTCQQRTGRHEEDGCWPSFE